MSEPEFYQAKDGHRWRLRSGNGRIIAESGEAYVDERGARRGFSAVLRALKSQLYAPQAAPQYRP